MRGWLTCLLLTLVQAHYSAAMAAAPARAHTASGSAAVTPQPLAAPSAGFTSSSSSASPSPALTASTSATSATTSASTSASAASTAGTTSPWSAPHPRPASEGAHATAGRPTTPSAAVRQTSALTAHDRVDDDEDPPVSLPAPANEYEATVGWSARGPRGDNPEGADLTMDVRFVNAYMGHAQKAEHDPDALQPSAGLAAAPDDDVHPGWRLLNSKRCGLSKGAVSDRIVGGVVAGLGQYPWLARIGYNLEGVPRRVYRCAGAIITHVHVLTAAHCVKNLPENFEFAGVRLGEWDTTTDPDCQNSMCAPPVYDMDPESVIVHQEYNNPRFANDIALVKLAQKINFNGWVAPVCIPYGDLLNKNYESERTEVAGWGIFDLNLQKSSQELRTVHLPVVSNSICHALYRNQANITKKQMCAGGEIGFDACSGDSGGPLLKVEAYGGGPRYYIVGIVSFGSKRCGLTPSPGVYTRVSYYMEWILDNIVQA